MQRTLIHLHNSANPRSEAFVDHAGVLRDARTGRPINGRVSPEAADAYDDMDTMRKWLLVFPRNSRDAHYTLRHGLPSSLLGTAGYSFFDSGDIELLGRRKRAPAYYNTGISCLVLYI